jgi:hypothetical protein
MVGISIYALEKLIAESEMTIANCQKQLRDLEAGTIHLSAMKQASIEGALEKATNDYNKYKETYDAIPEEEKEKFRELVRVQEGLAKQSYYKLQKIRLKRNKNLKRKQKLEAMMILDELPHDIHFDDPELIEVTDTIIKYNIREVFELEKELAEINDDFEKRLEVLDDEQDLKHFTYLDSYIPIILLHFKIFVEELSETIEVFNSKLDLNLEKDKERHIKFKGLPRYEDWWIEELFKNHQAYFGLYKWKDIISNFCITEQLQELWEKIFSNWLMVKKILCTKDENAYDYTFIFDDMVRQYAELEEELDMENLQSMEKIVLNITKKEDFTKLKTEHRIDTTYYRWKKKKIEDSSK